MRKRRAKNGGAGARLFVLYAGASLVLVTVLGMALIYGYEREAFDGGLKQGRDQAAVIEEMAIAPALAGGDLDLGLSVPERERLQNATDLAIFNGSVVGLRVRSFSGKVVFSDDGSTVTALSASHPAFRQATIGHTDVAIVADPADQSRQVIRVLQPIVARASGQSSGVLELYLPYGDIAKHMNAQIQRTYTRLIAGLAAVYALLAVIAWSTTSGLRRHAAQHEHDALHDPLTGLANRKLFQVRAQEATQRAGQEPGAVVVIDLDRFKEVNDTLGHHVGDELLIGVARRLTDAVRAEDTVARLGGDEFGLILPGLSNETLVRELLTRVEDVLAAARVLGSTSLTVEGSFGVAFYPAHGEDAGTLLKCADAAMYRAKRGRLGIVIHEDATASPAGHLLVHQSELRRALANEELVLHYLPKVDLGAGVVCGVEALARWAHPEHGLLGPAQFLRVAEEPGLAGEFTARVLQQALRDKAAWTAMGVDWPVTVNVSVRDLERPAFPETVAKVLSQHGIDPRGLQIDVTETAVAADSKIVGESVTALAEHGIRIAVGGVGVGHTSVSQLRRLPVTEVKIDRILIKDLARDERDQAIVRSLIELAHGIGLQVTAAGVETAVEADWLTSAGCDYAQGHLYARPAPWPELVRQHTDAVPSTTRPTASTEGTS